MADHFEDFSLLIGRFRGRWQRGEQPAIEEFLPGADDVRRGELLLELVRADMCERARLGWNVRVEDYVARFPEIKADVDRFVSLLIDEYQMRNRAGERPFLSEYAGRFPEHFAALENAMGRTAAGQSPRAEVSLELSPGTIVGDFEILRLLGKGGFSRVYLARQGSLQREIALKVSARSGDEGRTLAALEHPHIVPVFTQQNIAELHVLAMQYVPGLSFAALIASGHAGDDAPSGASLVRAVEAAIDDRDDMAVEPVHAGDLKRLSFLGAVCRLIAQVADALDYAHRKEILHCDIKPENILLTRSGQAMLMDFNVATRGQSPEAGGDIVIGGTPAYMSPEQLRLLLPDVACGKESVDARSDIYSLGIVFFELLTGRHPFGAAEPSGSLAADALQLLAARLQPLNVRDGADLACPAGLKPVIEKCLHPDPGERYERGGHLAEDLRRYVETRPLRYAKERNGIERIRKWLRRRRRVVTSVATLAAMVAAVIIYDSWSTTGQLRRARRLTAQATSAIDKPVTGERVTDEPGTGEPGTGNARQLATDAMQVLAERQPWISSGDRDRRFADAYFELGTLYVQQDRFREAVALLRKATELDPALGAAFNNLGIAYFRSKMLAESLAAFDAAIEAGSDGAEVFAHRGASRVALGDYVGARHDFNRALEIDPQCEAATIHLEMLSRLERGESRP